MCGRYTQTATPENLIFRFGLDDGGLTLAPRYNIAPGQDAPVVVNPDGSKILKLMHWGLVPSWAKDPAIGNKMINARAETLAEKTSFKRLLSKKRCLVLADGFYEWTGKGRERQPLRFVLKSREPFAFAGLWDRWKKPDGKDLDSFTIVTTSPNDFMAKFHHRMPVILPRDDEEKWLDSDLTEPSEVTSLLQPYPSEEMEAYFVSRVVNSPANDRPECIQPRGA